MMEYVLKTDKLTKVYGKSKVVNNVSMHVNKGDIYGFIGKNGAGKTTFMRMVTGLAAPASGSIELFGSGELEKKRIHIGSLIESPGFYANMTAEENLIVLCKTFGITGTQVVKEALATVGLAGADKKKVKNFSMGMKQRIGIAVSLLRSPDFLILDEPINGLDPEGIREIRELLLKLNREREITILISSHILGELSKIATRYGIIRDGELIEEFMAEELKERCRRCQKLVVNAADRAANVLEETLHIKNYEVLDANTLRVFEGSGEPERINRALILGGVEIRQSYAAGWDLEGYFMDLLGGGENA